MKISRTFLQIGIAVMFLSAVLSLMGLFWKDLYQDTNWLILKGWWINDWITLIMAVPLFLLSIYLVNKGSKRGFALLAGLMTYTVYNYSYYLFGAAFNVAFIGYVLIFVLGVFGLMTGVICLTQLLRKEDLPAGLGSKLISIYMILTAVFLSIGWVGQWLNFVTTGEKPPLLEQLEINNHLVAALDMTLVVPWFILGAVLLWKRKGLGLVISIMVHVKAVIYNVILLWGSIYQHGVGIEGAASLIPLWVFFILGSTASLLALFRSLKICKTSSTTKL